MSVRTKNNQLKKSIAINEISILRQSKQAASVMINNGKSIVIKKLISDGILVSTPAGSTAYNLSVHGPILNLDSKKLAITPISPFRPRRWRGTIISEKSKINIKNLNVNNSQQKLFNVLKTAKKGINDISSCWDKTAKESMAAITASPMPVSMCMLKI